MNDLEFHAEQLDRELGEVYIPRRWYAAAFLHFALEYFLNRTHGGYPSRCQNVDVFGDATEPDKFMQMEANARCLEVLRSCR